MFIADSVNTRIRKVAAGTGIITTVAGNGVEGFSGDGGPAINAGLNYPSAVYMAGSGEIYIADSFNNRIRRAAAGSGIITTVAGTGMVGCSGDGGFANSAS